MTNLTPSGDLVASGGEDGQVLVWDPRAGREPRHRLAPHTQAQLARPHLGRFVASLDLYNDWLVSGLCKHNCHMGSLSVQ